MQIQKQNTINSVNHNRLQLQIMDLLPFKQVERRNNWMHSNEQNTLFFSGIVNDVCSPKIRTLSRFKRSVSGWDNVEYNCN